MATTALPAATSELNGSPPPSGAPATTALPRTALGDFDLYQGGNFRVPGTTRNKGTPDFAVSRRVRLHDQPSGLVVREEWSEVGTGNYYFNNVRSGLFYIVSFDHTNVYNGVIATNVASEPMP